MEQSLTIGIGLEQSPNRYGLIDIGIGVSVSVEL